MNLGPTELVLILVIVLVIFGAGKLPQVFGSLGKGIKEFRDASEGRDESTAAGREASTTTAEVRSTVAPATAVRTDSGVTPAAPAPVVPPRDTTETRG